MQQPRSPPHGIFGSPSSSPRLLLLQIPYVFLFLALGVAVHGNPDAKRLYDDLLSSYNRLIRPVGNNNETITVWMRLRLSQLIDLVSPYSEDFIIAVVRFIVTYFMQVSVQWWIEEDVACVSTKPRTVAAAASFNVRI